MNSARGLLFEPNKRPETFYELLLERAGLWKAIKDVFKLLARGQHTVFKKKRGETFG